MTGRQRRPIPLLLVLLGVGLIIWAVVVLLSPGTLDTTEKLFSVLSSSAGIVTLVVTLFAGRRPAVYRADDEVSADVYEGLEHQAEEAQASEQRLAGRIVLLVAASVLTVTLVVWLVSKGSDNRAPAASRPVPVPATPAPTQAPSATPAEPEPACPTAAAGSTNKDIRRSGTLLLAPSYSADLDSICLDWGIATFNSSGDLINDAVGLAAVNTNTQLAIVEPKAPSQFSMCASNTNYVSTITYKELKPGNRYCVYTGVGRRSLLKVISVGRPTTSGRTVRLSVTTWQQQQQQPDSGTPSFGILVLILIGLAFLGRRYSQSRRQQENYEAVEDDYL